MREAQEAGRASLSADQRKQLQALKIVPFDISSSNAYLYQCNRDSPDFERIMKGRVEVGTAFDVSGEEYYSSLNRTGKLRKPIETFSKEQLWLLKRFVGLFQNEEHPRLLTEEGLKECIVHNHGFWPLKEMPYIVARPTAIILPEMGMYETCTLLDVYELENFGDCPESIPRYAKDLMLCRLFVMKQSGLLTNESNIQTKGIVLFGKVNVTREDLQENPRVPLLREFEVVLRKTHENEIMFTWINFLSLHYLEKVLPEFPYEELDLGIDYPLLNPEDLDEFPLQKVWKQELQFDYRVGKVLICRKDGRWGRIFKQREMNGEAQFGVSWDDLSFRSKSLARHQRVTYYSSGDLDWNACVPPVCFPVHPCTKGELVMVMGSSFKENENRTRIRDYTRGMTVSEKDAAGFIQCKLEREDGVRIHTLSADRLLVLDVDKYSQDPADAGFSFATNQSCLEVFEFRGLSFSDIKGLFEITDKCDLIHDQKKGSIAISRNDVEESKKKLLEDHADCHCFLSTFKKEITCLPRQKLIDHIYLECSRGAPKKQVLGNRSTKKVGCKYRIRLCRYDDCGSIYAARIHNHSGHDSGALCPHEPVPQGLRQHILKVHSDLGCTPWKTFMVLQSTGKSRGLSDDCMRRLTLKLVQREIRKAKQASIAIQNDDDSILHIYQQNKRYFWYCDTTPGDMQAAIMSPMQKEVLRVCHKMIFIDACHSLDRKGDVTLAMVVRDPFGNAFPVAFCLCSGNENARKWKRFLRAVLQECDLDSANITFMMDKSTACIAAMNQLNYHYVFCIFHVMQAVGRFLRMQHSGVSGRDPQTQQKQRDIKMRLHRLVQCLDEGEFDHLEADFIAWLDRNDLRNVKEYYLQEWSRVQDRWSKHDRGNIRHMRSHTNNLIERFFGTLKYQFLEGRRQRRRDEFICILLNKVIPYHVHRLSSKLHGLEIPDSEIRRRRYHEGVQACKEGINPVRPRFKAQGTLFCFEMLPRERPDILCLSR